MERIHELAEYKMQTMECADSVICHDDSTMECVYVFHGYDDTLRGTIIQLLSCD